MNVMRAWAVLSAEVASPLDYVAVVIAGLSLVISLVLGVRNRGTAKRALALSEAQEARRAAKVELHVNEALSWRRRSEGDRLLGFHLLVTNPTDRQNSLVDAELHLTYGLNGVLTTVKVPHLTNATGITLPTEVDLIEMPTRLDANQAVSGWFVFRITDGLTLNRPIDRYDVIIRDVHGIDETVQVSLFREAVDCATS
jgi:hypothetical protein